MESKIVITPLGLGFIGSLAISFQKDKDCLKLLKNLSDNVYRNENKAFIIDKNLTVFAAQKTKECALRYLKFNRVLVSVEGF